MTRGFLDNEHASRADLVDVPATLVAETEKAWQVDLGGDIHWLPKSQVEFDGQTLTLPKWLAEDRGIF